VQQQKLRTASTAVDTGARIRGTAGAGIAVEAITGEVAAEVTTGNAQ